MSMARLSHKIILGLLTICLFSFVAIPLQWWDYSNYRNINAAQLVFWGASVLLAIVFLAHPHQKHIPNPILWAILGIIISIVLLPFIDYPVSSIIGSPVGNFGIVQNLAGVMVAFVTYSVCKDNPKNQGILVVFTTMALITFTAIGILYGKTGVPFEKSLHASVFGRWGDIYALMAMPCLIIMAVGLYNPYKNIKYMAIFGITVIAFAIYVSDNNASLFLFLSMPFIYGFLCLLDKYGKKLSFIKPYLILLTGVAITLIIMMLITIMGNLIYEDGTLRGWQSLLERSLLLQAYITSIEQDIIRLFTGRGWAQNHDIQQLYTPLTASYFEQNIRVYLPKDPRAIAAGGLGATSLHNVIIDIMAAIGVFGVLAFLGMLHAIGKTVINHNFVLIAWIVLMALYTVWFPTTISIAPFFVALGITCAFIPSEKQPDCHHIHPINTPVLQKTVCVLSAIFVAGGAFFYAKQINILSKTEQKKVIAPQLYYNSPYNQDAVNYSQGRHLLRKLSNPALVGMIENTSVSKQQLQLLLDTIDIYIKKSEDGNHTMSIELLRIINTIMLHGDDETMLNIRKKYYPLWQDAFETVVERAPYRFDLWMPYFEFLEIRKHYQILGNMTQYILKNGNPNDPIALLYRGIAFRALGNEQSAQNDFQRAIDYGVTSIIFNARDFLK